jgi:soluble lytic murein transglycosylase
MTLKGLAFLVSVVSVLALASRATTAEIYYYVDHDGVWHFTNLRTDRKYRIYPLKSRGRPPNVKKYEKIIHRASRRFGIAPSLIKAVIKAESDFDDMAVSHKGARGLMQLMPETADDLQVLNPFDPEENIFAGTRYLSLMLKRFKNDLKLALAAYNAGPTVVEAYRGLPPYNETRRYVKKVLHYYQSLGRQGP